MIKKYFIWFLILGFIIRIILAGISAWNFDTSIWYRFALDLKAGFGPFGHFNFSYPPALAAFFSVTLLPLIKFIPIANWGLFNPDLYGVQSWIVDPNITSPIFNFMFKIPMIIGELLLVYLLFLYIKERISEEKAKWIAVLWYLNPLIIFIVAVHGQLDIYPVLFLFLGVTLLYVENQMLAGLMVGIAISMKMYPIFLVLPFAALILSAYEGKKVGARIIKLGKFIIGLLLPLVLSAFYLLNNDKARELVFNRFRTTGFEGSLNLGSINYIPWLVPFVKNHSSFLSQIETIGLILSVAIITFLVFFGYKKGTKFFKSYPLEIISVLVIFATYLFSQRTNPNYLIWSFPFLLIIIAKKPGLQIYYYIMSLAGLLFYFAINSFGLGILFLPLAQYFSRLNISISGIMHNYLYFDSLKGIINGRLMYDAYLISAIIFIFSLIAISVNLSREIKNPRA